MELAGSLSLSPEPHLRDGFGRNQLAAAIRRLHILIAETSARRTRPVMRHRGCLTG